MANGSLAPMATTTTNRPTAAGGKSGNENEDKAPPAATRRPDEARGRATGARHESCRSVRAITKTAGLRLASIAAERVQQGRCKVLPARWKSDVPAEKIKRAHEQELLQLQVDLLVLEALNVVAREHRAEA